MRDPTRGELTWAQLRPLLIGALLAADTFVVAALAIARPPEFLAPLIAFSVVLIGLVAGLAWALAHRDEG